MESNVPVTEETTDMSQPFDLVVVGAEAAGLAAANRAVDLAGRVLLLEKGSEVGGSGRCRPASYGPHLTSRSGGGSSRTETRC
jgi:flavin-dependent dehydrogenase